MARLTQHASEPFVRSGSWLCKLDSDSDQKVRAVRAPGGQEQDKVARDLR